MKRYLVIAAIIALAVTALLVSERRRVEAEVSPAPILYFVADTEHELTRIPVSLTRMPDSQEIQIGNEMARGYLESNKLEDTSENREIAAYVNEVGSRVAAQAHRKLPYQFHYIPQNEFVNAFALPGGHVFIGKGLINLMDSEDELANILGHEIEHADLGHSAERVQIEVAVQKAPLGAVAQLPIEIFQAGYSKEQELEADREGAKLAEAAGYSAEGAISMFRKLQKLQAQMQQHGTQRAEPRTVLTLPIELNNVVVMKTLQGYFRSHPPESERIAQMQKLIAAEHWPANQPEKMLEIAYLLATNQASNYFDVGLPDKALESAKKALATKPDYVPALLVIAEVDFEKADFSGAARAYKKVLQLDPAEDQVAVLYATSLSASLTAKEASAQFTAAADALPKLRERAWFLEEQAGLKLMTGDTSPARSLAGELETSNAQAAPLLLGRLGWWYYRFGDITTAAALMEKAVEQRPQVAWLTTKLGWILIAQRKYQSAEERLHQTDQTDDANMQAESEMALAVCAWNEGRRNPAVSDFAGAINKRAAWSNPQWVSTLYGPQVAGVTEAIQAESERLKKARTEAKR